MEENSEDKIKKYLGGLSTFYINSILKLAAPDIIKDYPDYPYDLPKELTFKPKEKKQATPLKAKNNSKTPRIKEKPPKVAEKVSIKSKRHARLNRFKGSYVYDDKEMDYQLENDEMYVFKEEKVSLERGPSKIEFFEALSMNKTASISSDNSSKTSITSSDSKEVDKTFVPKKRKLRQLSDTSSDEEKVISTNSKKCLNSVDIVKESEKASPKKQPVEKKKDIVSSKSTANVPKSKSSTKAKHIPKVQKKSPNSGSFEQALKMIGEKKKELEKFIIPKVIPAPESDPAIKKVIKKKVVKKSETTENPNSHLGGIFTINNGWDKPVSENDNKPKSESSNLPRVKRHISQPKIVVDANLEDDILAAHEEFMYNENFLDNLSKSSPSYSDSSYANVEKHDDCSMESSTTANKPIKKIQSSLNSSEDYDSCDEEKIIKPLKKKVKPLFSDNEDEEIEPSENFKGANFDHDVISICADLEDFDDDDFEEEIPVEKKKNQSDIQKLKNNEDEVSVKKKNSQYDVQLDDLELVLQNVKRNIVPLDDQSEFDLNTKEISHHMVDPETDKVLKTFFGDACPAYLENRCTMPKCIRNHGLVEEEELRALIINAPFATLQSVYQVVLRFHRLFQVYVSVFVEICVKNKDDKGLIELVKACDRIPRTIVCYKDIVRKLVMMDYMKEHRAISFIIAHHTDSDIARDIILSLILDSGPCLPFFMDYIEQLHMKNPIRVDLFGRILHTCVAYQNPKLPYFCLNYLQGCSLAQMSSLNATYLSTFLQMNRYLSEVNESREAKSIIVIQKLLQSRNQ